MTARSNDSTAAQAALIASGIVSRASTRTTRVKSWSFTRWVLRAATPRRTFRKSRAVLRAGRSKAATGPSSSFGRYARQRGEDRSRPEDRRWWRNQGRGEGHRHPRSSPEHREVHLDEAGAPICQRHAANPAWSIEWHRYTQRPTATFAKCLRTIITSPEFTSSYTERRSKSPFELAVSPFERLEERRPIHARLLSSSRRWVSRSTCIRLQPVIRIAPNNG